MYVSLWQTHEIQKTHRLVYQANYDNILYVIRALVIELTKKEDPYWSEEQLKGLWIWRTLSLRLSNLSLNFKSTMEHVFSICTAAILAFRVITSYLTVENNTACSRIFMKLSERNRVWKLHCTSSRRVLKKFVVLRLATFKFSTIERNAIINAIILYKTLQPKQAKIRQNAKGYRNVKQRKKKTKNATHRQRTNDTKYLTASWII